MLLARTRVPRLLAHRRPPCSWRPIHGGATPTEFTNRLDTRLMPKQRSVYVRTSTFIESPAEAFAIIRALERKYGAISEYTFFRDFEVKNTYQIRINVSFHDTESFHRVPVESEVLNVVLPPVIANRPGGLGLDELESLLERQERHEEVDLPGFDSVMGDIIQGTEQNTAEKKGRTISCTVQRSSLANYTTSHMREFFLFRSDREECGRSFLNWGGFHEFKPIAKSTPIPQAELFKTSTLDHVRMRYSLRKWSDSLQIPNPYEISEVHPHPLQDSVEDSASQKNMHDESVISTVEQNTNKENTPDDWVPLPGFETVAEDVPTPRNVRPAKRAQRSHSPSISTDPTPLPPSTSAPVSVTTANSASDITLPAEEVSHNQPTQTLAPTSDVKSDSQSSLDSVEPPTIENSSTTQQLPPNQISGQLRQARKLAKMIHQQQKKPQSNGQKQNVDKSAPKYRKKPAPPPPVEEEGITTRLKGFIGGWF